MLKQKFRLICGCMVMIGLTLGVVSAQESGHATAVPPFQRISGVIRWSKEMGRPPREYLCEGFHVVVLDPEKDNKPYWFANVLTPGCDDPQAYSCKYEITVPTGKRLHGTLRVSQYGYGRWKAN